jgi:hypothetical protein
MESSAGNNSIISIEKMLIGSTTGLKDLKKETYVTGILKSPICQD